MTAAEHRQRLIRTASRLLAAPAARGARGGGEAMEAAAAGPETTARQRFSGQDQEIMERVTAERPISEADANRLEAIILPGLRPVFDIRIGEFEELPAPWTNLNTPAARERLRKCIRAVGRVDIIGHPRLAYGGTGFLVGPNLLLTNRHVASVFVNGVGARNLALTFRSRIDLKQEAGSEDSLLLTVTKATMVHPYWDAALLTVTGVPGDLAPLTLASDAARGSRLIAVVGYPAFDPRNNQEVQREVFRNLFEKKRLQPGYITGAGVVSSFGHRVEAATHDASTLGGNSGSAVVDVETGHVVGLHFAGVYLDTNYAVPSWELALDPNVVDLGVQFAKAAGMPGPPLPRPAWLSSWRELERPAASSSGGVVVGGSGGGGGAAAARAVAIGGDGGATWTIPIEVTIRLGTPARAGFGGTAAFVTARGAMPKAAADPLDQLKEARRRITEDPAAYYPEAEDTADAEQYYAGVQPDGPGLFDQMNQLLTESHTKVMPYKPTIHLYPVVDLQPDGDLISIYSEQAMDPEELIRSEGPMEQAIEAMIAAGASEETIADLEAIQTNSAEHVVPQSWFQQKQPMRGDLHHLFACERNCNSFRSNTTYWEFGPEEKVMEDCGRSERNEDKFEPKGGRGAVARATLYFLVRYAGTVDYSADRLAVLLRWHRDNPVSLYERHRNREIFLKQGNRNPFIDHADWADLMEFA